MRKTTKIIAWVVGVVVIALGAAQLYCFYPSSATTAALDLPVSTQSVVLVFHGTNGRDEPTLQHIARRITSLAKYEPNTVVLHYVWSPWSDNNLRAAVHGESIGAALGIELAELPELASIQLVGHSAGAYLMDPLCTAYRANSRSDASINMVFLDPMGIRGMLDFDFGYRNYGNCADTATSWFTADDPVPGTNEPLDHARNIDVTLSPERVGYTGGGHLWPAQAYLDFLTQ